MAGGKETPRQKMIGMMYLVLTALLAMNVSKEILDAFISLDTSIMTNAQTFEVKSSLQYNEMSNLYDTKPDKYREFYNRSEDLRKEAGDLKNYINTFKAKVMGASEKKDFNEFLVDGVCISLDTRDEEGKYIISKKDENQENTALVYGSSPQQPKEGEWTVTELRQKLEAFSAKAQSLAYSDRVKSAIANTFVFEASNDASGKERTWENLKFYHVPLAAMITELSAIESNVKRVETELMTDIMSNFEAKSYKFTTLDAMVIPESSYILKGDSFRAKVFLGAYDKNNQPTIYRSADRIAPEDSSLFEKSEEAIKLDLDENGFGDLVVSTNGMNVGKHAFNGVIEYNGPEGVVPIQFKTPAFDVATPSLVVSPSKMNVFYRGLPNPIEVSVPGIAQEQLKVSCAGHSLSKDKDGWVIKPGKGKEAIISVSATMPDGSTQNMGKKEFRVKRIPDPVPKFAGKKPSDNTVKSGEMKIAAGVRAEMEAFDFDVSVKVKSFNMVFIRDGQVIEKSSNSNKVTSEMKANMQKVRKGQKVYIEKIMVTMPDGTTRQLANLSLKVV